MKIDYLTIIVKPTNACNMRCKHCYHAEKGYDSKIMSPSLYEHLFKISFSSVSNIKFIWHGGEPLLVGEAYLQKMIDFQNNYPHPETNITNNIQTNGTLITNDIAVFLSENHFDIGISYDGPYNDVLREKTKWVEDNILILQNKKIPFGVLSVITSKTIENIIDIYNFFKNKSIDFKFSYIFYSGEAKRNEKLMIDSDKYALNYLKLFNYWLHDTECNIRVDNFEKIISLFIGNGPRECEFSSCMYHYLSVDSIGNIYPCGRSYSNDYCLGNIMEYNDIYDVFQSQKYNEIVIKAIMRRNKCRESCSLYRYCQGGCNNNAIMDGDLSNVDGYSCQLFKKTFALLLPILEKIPKLTEDEMDLLNPMFKSYYNKYHS